MSKYARTKDGIFELTGSWGYLNWTVEQIINNERVYETVQPPHFLKEVDIIKEAYTIEELCDEFVVCVKGKPICQFNRSTWNYNEIKYLGTHDDFYGAIWTDKGLIYVAKMNDKGELELL